MAKGELIVEVSPRWFFVLLKPIMFMLVFFGLNSASSFLIKISLKAEVKSG